MRFATDTSTSDPGIFQRSVAADAVRFVSNDAEAPLYVHADHLGTPQRMTDQAGALAWDRVAKPFGGTVSLTGTATNPQRFPGQLNDPETGFSYNYFRDYDPTTGRYLQSDPIGLGGGLNTYAYVGGNPVNYYDPDGEDAQAAATLWWSTVVGDVLVPDPTDAALPKWAGYAAAGAGVGAYLLYEFCSADNDDPSCDEHFTRCLDTSLADLPGSVYGSSRCGVCRDQCVRNSGTWPDIAITGSGAVRCDYWNFQ